MGFGLGAQYQHGAKNFGKVNVYIVVEPVIYLMLTRVVYRNGIYQGLLTCYMQRGNLIMIYDPMSWKYSIIDPLHAIHVEYP